MLSKYAYRGLGLYPVLLLLLLLLPLSLITSGEGGSWPEAAF
jgi:hypothetical protein